MQDFETLYMLKYTLDIKKIYVILKYIIRQISSLILNKIVKK